jgi:hypothetical protein
MAELIVIMCIAIAAVLVVRLIGAWMLRINDVIDHQKAQVKQNNEIIKLLKERG